MQVQRKNLSDTNIELTVAADAAFLQAAKQAVLRQLARSMRLPGFRAGKAPLHLVEKSADAAVLQSEFLDRAANQLFRAAVQQEHLRVVSDPQVTINKFVPFDSLEITLKLDVVGPVKLPDYKKIKLAKKPVSVSAAEVTEVLDNLRQREAVKKDVGRAARDGDQVWIDFAGTDAKTNEPIPGADGQNYPLTLGSNTFIPGFEPELIGLKANGQKTFTLTFPQDYHAAALQNRKVMFAVTLNKVQEVALPKLDDAFAAKAGPFKTLAELKADIKKQMQAQKEYEAEQAFADEVVTRIAEAATVAIPQALIDDQLDRLINDRKQNALYSGQTWPEFLKAEGKDENAYRESLKPQAELRVKAGLVIAEIAERENITVSEAELQSRIAELAEQYKRDPQMQAELAKPENQRDIAARMVNEKTIAHLAGLAGGK